MEPLLQPIREKDVVDEPRENAQVGKLCLFTISEFLLKNRGEWGRKQPQKPKKTCFNRQKVGEKNITKSARSEGSFGGDFKTGQKSRKKKRKMLLEQEQ